MLKKISFIVLIVGMLLTGTSCSSTNHENHESHQHQHKH